MGTGCRDARGVRGVESGAACRRGDELTFPIVDADDWTLWDYEPTGDDRKEWLRAPDGRLWLFKPRTEKPDRVQGEDWCEKVAAEVADILGVPHARVTLAARNESRGSLSLDVKPDQWSLQAGAVLLPTVCPNFVAKSPSRLGHNLSNISAVLRDLQPPPGEGLPSGWSAFDVFVGYLVLDAVIANQDRHEENWAVVLPPSTSRSAGALAPSFDHGSSLGFGLTDPYRRHRLDGDGVEHWAARGLAARYELLPHAPRPTLVKLAALALSRVDRAVRDHWLSQVAALDVDRVETIMAEVPELSEDSRTFTVKIVEINRRRVLDEC